MKPTARHDLLNKIDHLHKYRDADLLKLFTEILQSVESIYDAEWTEIAASEFDVRKGSAKQIKKLIAMCLGDKALPLP